MELMTIQEAADALRVKPITVRRYINAGRLAGFRVGRGLRVSRESVERLPEPVQRDVAAILASAKPTSADDPLWNIIGIADGDESDPTDMSANKHRYLAEAYAPKPRKG
jgi:excisionase family DNA binding protein